MTADRALQLLQRLAELQARTLKPHQARRAARVYSALAQLRIDVAESPTIRSAIRRLRAIERVLSAPNRPCNKSTPKPPGRPPAFTDAEFDAAARVAGGSIKSISQALRADRGTVRRYLAKNKMRQKGSFASSSPSDQVNRPALSGLSNSERT